MAAPSLLPQKPGDRVTTDCWAAVPWASLARSGHLTAVSVTKVADEAMRDLTRAREDAISALQDAQWRLKAFWLRPARRYVGRANGGQAHLRCSLRSSVPPVQHLVLQAYVRAVSAHRARLQPLAQELPEHVTAWRGSPVVEALQALRGVPCPVAVPL